MATLQKKVSRGCVYWQIVESRRVLGKPRPIVLAHLGTAETLLKRLQGADKPFAVKVFQFGAIAALWQLAKKLNIVQIIDEQVGKRAQGLSCGQYILLAALNRTVSPTSKACLHEWYQKTILPRLLPAPKRLLSSQRFWDHMSFLEEQDLCAIEEKITRRVLEEFDIERDTLLFDATNFDTFINTQTKSELAQRGRAKSKRKDLRILGLALLVSADFHIPLLSHVYPGNENDAKMFGCASKALLDRFKLFSDNGQRITLVFDGGNTSEENIKTIEKSYDFVTSLTVTHHKDLLAIPLAKFRGFENPCLEGTSAYRTFKVVWDELRAVVVTRSQKLLNGQLAGIGKAIRRKRKQLRELRAKLVRSQKPGARGKGYTNDSLEKRLKEICNGQYISEIMVTEITERRGKLDFSFYTDGRAFEKLKSQRLGKRILCTNNTAWSTEKIILASRAQYQVEHAIKQMKNPYWASFRPSFHWTDQKLRVHAFYCYLALLLSSLLRRIATKQGQSLSIPKLLQELSEIKEVLTLRRPHEKSHAGRPRSEYAISERSPLQIRLSDIFDIDKLSHQ